MALNKITYVDNVTVIPASNLNAIQDEIIANESAIGTNTTNIASAKSEVEDIRVGADGTTYATAGDAVRGQIKPISESTQNIFNINQISASNITVADNVISGTAAAFNTAFGANTNGICPGKTFETNSIYTISFDAMTDDGGTGNGLAFVVTYTDNTVGYFVCNMTETSFTHHSNASASGKTISKIGIGYFANSSATWHVKNIQIEKGSIETEYTQNVTAVDTIARKSIASLETEIYSIENGYNSVDVTTNGGFATSGITYGIPNRIRTDLIPLKKGDKIVIENGTLQHACGMWNGVPSSSTNTRNDSSFSSDMEIITATYDGYLVVVFRKSDNTAISPSEFDGSVRLIKEFGTHAQVRFLRGFGIGDCTVFKFSDGTNLIIDFGLNEAQGVWQSSFNAVKTELGITHIDNLIISHYHRDHCGLLLDSVTNGLIDADTTCYLPAPFTAEQLVALQEYDQATSDTVYTTYNAVSAVLTNCKKIYPTENKTYYIGGAMIEFWNTDHTQWLNEIAAGTLLDYNACSLCNYVTIGDTVMNFSGDINVDVMEKYINKLRPCNIYKSHHHSVGYPKVNRYMSTVMPDMVITMLGRSMAMSESYLGAGGVQIWCEENYVPNFVTGTTDRTLGIAVSENGYKWTTNAMRTIMADELE